MQSKSEYISYERAMAQLRKRLGATPEVTPEELAAWIFMSRQHLCDAKFKQDKNDKWELVTDTKKYDDEQKKVAEDKRKDLQRCCTNEVLEHGGMCESHREARKEGELTPEEYKAKLIEHKRHNLVAFTDAGELDRPPRFFFGNYAGERDYLPLLYRCWFKADDIATFEPGERFITGEKLLERWAARNAIPPSERIKIASRESRLNPLHPTLGLTQATFPDADYAPLEDGLFSLAEVKAYEREEFGGELDAMATGKRGAPAATVEAGAGTTPAPVTRTNKLRRNNLDPAIDKAINMAGNMELADVYLQLKELAISGEKPFTGEVTGDMLHYTNDVNHADTLSKEKLRKRLDTRKRNAV